MSSSLLIFSCGRFSNSTLRLKLELDPACRKFHTSGHLGFQTSGHLGFHTSSHCCKKKKGPTRLDAFKKNFLPVEDANKRPSALEIERKDLPANQPTLRERVERDRRHAFHQFDEKHGYWTNKPLPILQQIKVDLKADPKRALTQNFKKVAGEFKKLKDEVDQGNYSYATQIKKAFVLPGERSKEWGFQSELELDDWILTRDSDWGEGYSSAEFELNKSGTAAILKGDLSTRVPNDGRTHEAGYVNIASVNKRKSFGRLRLMPHWMNYTHLTMMVRGDGRKYMINLKIKRDFDIAWDDRWHYPLYTRGGPYWQYVKIPFSKFYFGHAGYIQDRQEKVNLMIMQGISFTLKDRISGPFQLEIKDISLHYDPTGDDEDFAYEMYRIPAFWNS